MFQFIVIEPVKLISDTWHSSDSVIHLHNTIISKEQTINILQQELKKREDEVKMYRDILYGQLGLVELQKRDLQRPDLANLKSMKLGGHTWAHRKLALEKKFSKENKAQ